MEISSSREFKIKSKESYMFSILFFFFSRTVFLRGIDDGLETNFDLISGRMDWCEDGKIHV